MVEGDCEERMGGGEEAKIFVLSNVVTQSRRDFLSTGFSTKAVTQYALNRPVLGDNVK